MSRVFEHIFLDFDGVVADTEEAFALFDAQEINDVLAKAGFEPFLTPEIMRGFAGIPAENKLEIIAAENGFDAAPYMDGFTSRRNEKRPELLRECSTKLAPGFRKFMEKYGDRCTLVTNKSRQKLEWDLEALGIAGIFNRTVWLEPPMKRKPAPDLLLKALELSGATAKKCAYVGDNELDMRAAIAADLFPLGFVIEGLKQKPERERKLRDAGAVMVIDDFEKLAPHMA